VAANMAPGALGTSSPNMGCSRTLKTELIYLEDFDTHEQAQPAVFEDIEVVDNRQRCHTANGYLTPLVYEQA
jgi:Integrase core domain